MIPVDFIFKIANIKVFLLPRPFVVPKMGDIIE